MFSVEFYFIKFILFTDFIQWNCHSVSNKIDSLKDLSSNHDIIALSETWLKPDSYFNLYDFHIFKKDSTNLNQGGLLIAIRRSIPFTFLGRSLILDPEIESLGISIPYSDGHLLLLSIYKFPQSSITEQQWTSFFLLRHLQSSCLTR